jgi:hypothetical protein
MGDGHKLSRVCRSWQRVRDAARRVDRERNSSSPRAQIGLELVFRGTDFSDLGFNTDRVRFRNGKRVAAAIIKSCIFIAHAVVANVLLETA